MPNKTGTATLTYGDKALELPMYSPTVGPDVIDISKLYAQGGVFTHDPGFTSTSSCESAITFIDGEKGELLYRGYPIDQLAEKSHYLEVCFLLLYGHLPTAEELENFEFRVTRHTMVHEQLMKFFSGYRRDAHPMATLVGVVGALSAFYHDSVDISDPWQREVAAVRMIAKLPTITAMAYKYSIGQPFVYPKNSLDYASNFLYMCFSVPAEEFEVNPILSRAMDRIFTLHADHEQNASTSVMRSIGSAYADPYSAMAGAAAALFGPRHGGANEAVVKMLNEIGDAKNVPIYVDRVKKGEFRLMGFGHRVYKNYDPRAKIIKKIAYDVFDVTGTNPLIDVAVALEQHALEDDYFVSRKLYPNVDFYSGIIYQAMRFPPDMFTVLFTLGRAPGWLAQWSEMITDSDQKIARPRQIYLGTDERNYVPVAERG